MTGSRDVVLGQVRGPRAMLFLVLSVLTALTEGAGLLLLVPMLGALDASGGGGGPASGFVARLGRNASLEALLAAFVALVLLRAVIKHWAAIVATELQHELVDGLRMRAWLALLRCDWRLLSRQRQTDNASLLITNVDRVGSGAYEVIAMTSAGLTLAGLGLAALAIAPSIAAAAAVGGTVVLAAYRGLRRRASGLGEMLGVAYARVHGTIAEGLGALRVIKSFGAEDRSERELAGEFATLRATERRFVRDRGIGQIALQGGGGVLLALLVWFAIRQRHADVATVLPMVVLFARALPLLGAVQESWQRWLHARPALAATGRLIRETEAAREPEFDAALPRIRVGQSIALRGVTVIHPGRRHPALDAVDLTLPVHTITALCGPSGSGKSSISDVLGALVAPDRGALVIDGITLGAKEWRAWRREVAYVQQEPILFSGSIRQNLAWADPSAGEDRLREALAMGRAEFVFDLPDGLDSLVGEGGRQLSGGEKQRIVLARALLRSPQLLILDEAASALDRDNEEAIAEAIRSLRDRMTILVTGHRGALPAIADRTVRIESGRIAAAG